MRRKVSGRKGGRRKGAPGRGPATKGPGRRATSLTAVARASYEERRAEVIGRMDRAFAKAVSADSLSGLEKLLATMEKAGRMF